jgi:hypothetical protein
MVGYPERQGKYNWIGGGRKNYVRTDCTGASIPVSFSPADDVSDTTRFVDVAAPMYFARPYSKYTVV